MFAFLAFGFKLLFATLFGGALSYEPGKANGDMRILYSALSAVFAAALIGLSRQFPDESSGLMAGACIVAIVITIVMLSREMNLVDRITLLFAAVIGMIIGAGFIFQSAMLTGLVYFIQKHSHSLLSHIEPEHDLES